MRHTRQVGGGRRSGASPARRCAYLPRALGWKGSWSFGARAGVCRCVSLRGESGSARGSGACPYSSAGGLDSARLLQAKVGQQGEDWMTPRILSASRVARMLPLCGAWQHGAQQTRGARLYDVHRSHLPSACTPQVRVEIGTQAGALVFHIAMEDVFMWSRKARQFLNKCRDFMAVTDDVRPAGYVHAFSPCARAPGAVSPLSVCASASAAHTRLPFPNLCTHVWGVHVSCRSSSVVSGPLTSTSRVNGTGCLAPQRPWTCCAMRTGTRTG